MLAVAAVREQLADHPVERRPVLVVLAVGHDDADARDARRLERPGEPLEVKRRDGVVGDDRHAPLRDGAGDEVRAREQAAPDMDRVAAVVERYADSLHVSGRRFSSCSTSAPTLWRPVSTTRSATSR